MAKNMTNAHMDLVVSIITDTITESNEKILSDKKATQMAEKCLKTEVGSRIKKYNELREEVLKLREKKQKMKSEIEGIANSGDPLYISDSPMELSDLGSRIKEHKENFKKKAGCTIIDHKEIRKQILFNQHKDVEEMVLTIVNKLSK